jgi:hypothetical protein
MMDDNDNAVESDPIEYADSLLTQPHQARVALDIDLAANKKIDISIEILGDGEAAPVVLVSTASSPPALVRRSLPRLPKIVAPALPRLGLQNISIDAKLLFGIAFGIYLVTQLISLPSFPIYFFCDEAVNVVLAADFIRDGFRNYDDVFLPTFFKNGGQYCLGTTVYMQMLPLALFGKSVWIARGFFVLFSSLTAVFSTMILRDIFKNRYWWSAPLWLAAIPTWFLHARGAFEYAPMVTFYTGFLYFYLRYRSDTPRMLYPALICGALAFYTYTPGQLIIVVTGLLLLAIDWRYHLKHWRVGLRGTAILILLAAPLVRFWMLMPDEYANRLSMYGSYWAEEISLLEKIGRYLGIYVSGLNPLYWFFPHTLDNPLHTMKGYGHIHWLMLLPFLGGVWQAVRKHKSAEMRVLLVALLAAPAGTAVAELHPNRALVIVIPIIVLGLVGFTSGIDWLKKRDYIREGTAAAGMLFITAAMGFIMTTDALTHGPTWYSNYGLSGMQWGARQVYATAMDFLKHHPERTLYISPNWTFQAEVVRSFFAPGEEQIRIGTTDAVIGNIDPHLDRKAFVLMPDEYERVRSSGRFEEPEVDEIISYPNGLPGFYFVRLAYVDDIQEIVQSEQAERHRLDEAKVRIGDHLVRVRHTPVEGELMNFFDGNPDSLAKTKGINPLLVELNFDQAVLLAGITARVGAEQVQITVTLEGEDGQREYTVQGDQGGPYKDVPVVFDKPERVTKLRFTLLDENEPETNIVHLWELTLDDAR